MSGFTKGPWAVEQSVGDEWWFGGDNGCQWVIYTPPHSFDSIAVVGGEYGNKEQEATARLIAAAPDLLEALQKVVSCFDIKDGLSVRDEQAIKHAASVIHKATGAAS